MFLMIQKLIIELNNKNDIFDKMINRKIKIINVNEMKSK